ncbi:MAG TPA: hypothetical protein VFL29_03140 [Candidatus Dormibacteraeota bacterium]|nr:hypothetical protein [Candidatus Dormibacteraeota bacterium]
MGITIGVTWLFAFLAGGMTMLGLASIITGRLVFGLGYSDWSEREARQLGAIYAAWGGSFGLYALYGGLTLGSRSFPDPLIGHWWGIVIPFLPAAVLMAGLFLQLRIVNRHRTLAARRSVDR